MKKIWIQVMVVFLIGFMVIAFDFTYDSVFSGKRLPAGNKVIIIDAGHGGRDPGAVSSEGAAEKDINLKIAQKLKAYLEENGNTCIMVREVDEGLYSEDKTGTTKKSQDMKARKEIIKSNRADMFISIHLNSFPQSKYYGAQVFYYKNDDKSKRLAEITQEELVRVLDKNNKREAKLNNTYYILKENSMPSILVECGFLSNSQEARLLNDENYQNKIAWAIYCGLIRYFAEPEKSVTP